MYNWLKSLFGFPNNSENKRIANGVDIIDGINDSLIPFEHNCNCNKIPVDRLNSEEMWPTAPHFFMDPFQIHKHFEKLMENMATNFTIFGFDNFPSFGFQDGENDICYFEQPRTNSEILPGEVSMRDYVLNRTSGSNSQSNEKRDYIETNNKSQNDQISLHEMKDLLENADQKSSALHPINKNQSFGSFQSIVVKVSKQPDGSVHIVKKVKDSSGKDETTYTIQSNK